MIPPIGKGRSDLGGSGRKWSTPMALGVREKNNTTITSSFGVPHRTGVAKTLPHLINGLKADRQPQ